ncbi:hypothetical protein MHF_0681 [Mycoplasma haemofelis Ohio2]|uniref:Uncharacterized protein n=1 Tax=Mycoplasma haemofelis (strain Ohio2) TaxID=859194 RepID=F6FIA3_MYCHI|nr:hypothetical protein MHF_0681 [Mycoplasma haemofelis Ohio2]
MLISGMAKLILGSSALALGAGGVLGSFILGSENKDQPKSENHQLTKNLDSDISDDLLDDIEVGDEAEEVTIGEDAQSIETISVVEPSEQPKVPEEKKGCMVYVLESSRYSPWKFKSPTTREDFWSKYNTKTTERKRIEEACEKAKGGGILVFKEYWTGNLDYSSEKQNHSEFQKHLQGNRSR